MYTPFVDNDIKNVDSYKRIHDESNEFHVIYY